MEDSFQFIIESPQHNTGHKKRPRLVTSCDNCRLKKIKCLQPSPETKCEACKAAKIQCRFKDRERYFAERSRAIAGPAANQTNNNGYGDDQRRNERTGSLDAFSVGSNSSSPAMSSHSNARSNSHSPKAGGMVSPDVPSNGRYQSYSPDPRHAGDPRHASQSSMYAPRGSDPAAGGYVYSMSPQSYPPRDQPLFDTRDPQYPDQTIMQHFCSVFFHNFARTYPFLNYEDTMQDLFDHVLPALIQNCIAATAARYSDSPSLVTQGLVNVGETYATKAKTILQSIAHIPDLHTLHGIMLLSWLEYRNNRISAARSYFQMAWRMAYDLGLSEQNNHQPHLSDKERSRRSATWDAVHQLNNQINASTYSDHR